MLGVQVSVHGDNLDRVLLKKKNRKKICPYFKSRIRLMKLSQNTFLFTQMCQEMKRRKLI